MLVPVRCFSCGFPVGAFFEQYEKEVAAGKNPADVLKKIGLKRYCCRRMLISNVDLIEQIARFKHG